MCLFATDIMTWEARCGGNGPQAASKESCLNAALTEKCPSHFLLPCVYSYMQKPMSATN